jgi:hypothetical protein
MEVTDAAAVLGAAWASVLVSVGLLAWVLRLPLALRLRSPLGSVFA